MKGTLTEADLEGTPVEIIQRLAGRALPLSNKWGDGIVVGAWKVQRTAEQPHVRLLLAWPSPENPDQLFNEDARGYL